ncbi:MAG: DUF4912 domain-containing protein [Treponema sp.]|nr:DUF4912 domain-containing protein [Treponema sp.]
MEDNGVPVTRTWLESLSTDELIKLADTYGVDIPPELERIFIIEELLEIVNAQLNENDMSEAIEVNPGYSESALLPKQYNISFIEVIIRDPLWVFVFWEIKGHDREIHENAGDFNGYILRVIPLDNEGKEFQSRETSFSISVNKEDNARYLGLTEHTEHNSNSYVIQLNVIRGENELPIISSAPFILPRLMENETINELNANPLIRLSGVQDVSIIKNTGRQFRHKRL